MDKKTLRPAWKPRLALSHEWMIDHLRKYLGGVPSPCKCILVVPDELTGKFLNMWCWQEWY